MRSYSSPELTYLQSRGGFMAKSLLWVSARNRSTGATEHLTSGILPQTGYDIRARLIVDRPTLWTAWESVTSPGLLYSVDWLDLAGNLRADWILAGKMNARHLEVTDMLEIDAVTGAISLGKSSAFDLTSDGIYLGRTDDGGSTGFGFLAGKEIGGLPQYLQISSQDGLRVVNARHYVSGVTSPSLVPVVSSQTITLPIGTKALDLEVIAGGGGGAGATNDSSQTVIAASSGGATTVELWDGASYVGPTWSNAGGAGATAIHYEDRGYDGETSSAGLGGAGGAGMRRDHDPPQHGGDATGYGAGGGGGGGTEKGGNGGKASTWRSFLNVDISAVANPKLVITLGSGGSGSVGQGGAGHGGTGAPGRVQYRARSLELIPANVLPLRPTFTGTLSKAAGAVLVFPAFGAGLWVLSVDAGAGGVFDLGVVETHLDGSSVQIFDGSIATFISDKTPVDLASSASAITYQYQFFKMSEWA